MPVIKVENLYKQYQLGQVSSGTLSHDFNRWLHKIRGKEDPYEKITGLNNREQKTDSKYVWALENINFQINQGEILGIIGRNGAGKSTLLKILSKVTAPTKGQIKIRGRIASLLEVGTGFHPELTGRENIFLNGAILGMTKTEIKSKFDEIVAFSGVEKYIDTPVKRYSSGMYVRLAFAVAAHLEPEILVIDEVLAVGDADFQKKCLGKMKDVSSEGRTVLFVSHNMAAVKELCSVGLFLQNGQVNSMGSMQEIIQNYVTQNLATKLVAESAIDKEKFPLAQIVKSWISVQSNSNVISVDTDFEIAFEIEIHESDLELNLSMTIESALGQTVFNTLSESFITKKGNRTAVCRIPKDLLNNGLFFVTIVLTRDRSTAIQLLEEVLTFEVLDNRENEAWFGDISHHLIRPKLNWEI
jgi:lipopolysaccharide transport system ATP-binding protein